MGNKIVSLLFILLLIQLADARSFTYLYPTPADGSIYPSREAVINVSVFEDYPLKNCTLVMVVNQSKYNLPAEFAQHTCWREVDFLKNNSNYTFYITIEDTKGVQEASHNITFLVRINKEDCSYKSAESIRSCVIDSFESIWPGNSIQRFLIALLIIAGIFIVLDHLGRGKWRKGN